MRITFRGCRILANDPTRGLETDITQLVRQLGQYDILGNRDSVPQDMYKSWKILVLGSAEYDSTAYSIVAETARRLNERR